MKYYVLPFLLFYILLNIYKTSSASENVVENKYQRFTEAQKAQRKIFEDLKEFLTEIRKLLEGSNNRTDKLISSTNDSLDKINIDTIKAIVFGQTSTGKSTVINAMLHKKVVPTGDEHVTNCFIQVQGCSNCTESYVVDDQGNKYPLQNLAQMADARKQNDPNAIVDRLLTVYHPKNYSKLLDSNVVISDSPGVGKEAEYDSWVDKILRGADIFIMVSRAATTVTRYERDFVVRAKETLKISKPNVLILWNYFHNVEQEDDDADSEKVIPTTLSNQQRELTKTFFNNIWNQTLKDSEIDSRAFLVSAIEVFKLRSNKTIVKTEGWEKRKENFERFERCFEKLITSSAINTKFGSHHQSAHSILNEALQILNNSTNIEIPQKMNEIKSKEDKLNECIERARSLEDEYLSKIFSLKEELNTGNVNVYNENKNEIGGFVDEYRGNYQSSSNFYQDILNYVNQKWRNNWHDFCSRQNSKIDIMESERRIFLNELKNLNCQS